MTKWREAVEFKRRKLAELARQKFEDLASRPAREELKLQGRLRGLRCFIHRRQGLRGGVQITVEVQQRVLFIFLTRSEGGFEIFPDGRIEDV